MNKQTNIISTETLERVEGQKPSGWGAGEETIKVEILYRKEGRPRGYYLHLHTYRQLDDGGLLCDLFGHPSKYLLIQETKAFSAKTLATLTVNAAMIEAEVAAIKAKHAAYRAKQHAEKAAYAAQTA